jgi:hypothetical protein
MREDSLMLYALGISARGLSGEKIGSLAKNAKYAKGLVRDSGLGIRVK